MKPFLTRNIDGKGRFLRGIGAVALFLGAWFAFQISMWLGIVLVAFGVFVLFEALRGWCALRACGLKTKF